MPPEPHIITPSEHPIRPELIDGEALMVMRKLNQAGFYQIRPPGQDDVRPVSIAVNVDRREAELDAMDAREVVAAVGGAVDGAPTQAAPGGPDADRLRREDLERRQSLWRYLLIGALALLLLETLLSNRLGRRARQGGGHARATG